MNVPRTSASFARAALSTPPGLAPETVASRSEASARSERALARARLYHLLELALAHPGEGVVAFFADPTTDPAFSVLLAAVTDDRGASDAIATALQRFTTGLRQRDHAAVEADYIGLFAANYPIVPCPPYGSLYTTEDNKRLEEIMAVKTFFDEQGIELSGDFDDMPDHICVELELMQVLCFREHEAVRAGDTLAATVATEAAARFLDRFLVPFADAIARRAAVVDETCLYAPVLEAVRLAAADHLACLTRRVATAPVPEMPS